MIKLLTFLGPYLFFQMELIAANALLPSFGGSAYVWVSCVLFYTVVSFLGYLLVNFLIIKFNINQIKHIFSTLLFFSLFNILNISFKIDNFNETYSILFFLLKNLFLPLVTLSMSTPLAQTFLKLKDEEQDPTTLISLSNIGSLAGLLLYPFFINIYFSISTQILIWKFLLVFLLIVVFFIKTKQENKEEKKLKIFIFPKIVLASAVSTALMLAVTNLISMGVGSLPIIWTIPLLIFLLSFILNFKNQPLYSDRINSILIFTWLIIHIAGMNVSGEYRLLLFSVSYYFFLFIACHILARFLYLNRSTKIVDVVPYNLSINIGGMIGSLIILFVPIIFSKFFTSVYVDLYISIFLFFCFFIIRDFNKIKTNKLKFFSGLSVLLIFFLISNSKSVLEIKCVKNFYGTNRVLIFNGKKFLVNGLTVHGIQFLDEEKRKYPLTYYHINSPIADVFKSFSFKKVALIGLGAGSMAYYANSGDEYDFYELDPNIVKIANENFSYLKDSKATINTFIGDGRINLSKSNKQYDLIALDAFTNGYVPVHLLTNEAVKLYFKKLTKNGIVTFHISNTFIKIENSLVNVASSLNKKLYIKTKSINDQLGKSFSKWAVMVDKSFNDKDLLNKGWKKLIPDPNKSIWTDEKKNIFDVIF